LADWIGVDMGNRNWKHTPEAKLKIAAGKLGEKNPRFGKTNEQSTRWKGDAVGYCGVHDWMTENFGQPKHCESCGTTDENNRYEWANISGEYRRDRSDFIRLCKRCHNDMDGVNAHQVGAPPRKNRAMTKRAGKTVTSRYKGVRASGHGTWRATLKVAKDIRNLGSFPTQEAAAVAYNNAVIDAYGDDGFINEIE
jgi:hypothetical protein